MTIFLALLLSVASFASDKDTFDKTYPRDNSFCVIGGKKVEIMVRGDSRFTEPKERAWGEHVFARIEEKKLIKLPVTQLSGHYRMFQGNPSACTKSVGTNINGKFALVFQKHNSPHKHQVVVQYFDLKTLAPLETVHTQLRADRAVIRPKGIAFRTYPPARQDIQMGKVVINGKKYLYQDHLFPVWVTLTGKGLSIDPSMTFEDFSYRSFFKDADEFKSASGWMDSDMAFSNTSLYVAINHQAKSKCIVLLKEKKALAGDENWLCQ